MLTSIQLAVLLVKLVLELRAQRFEDLRADAEAS